VVAQVGESSGASISTSTRIGGRISPGW